MPPRKRWKGSAGKSATKRWKHSSQNGYEAAQALERGRNSASAGGGRNSASAGWGEEQRKALEEGGAAQALAGGKALKERIMWQEQRDALDRGRTNEKNMNSASAGRGGAAQSAGQQKQKMLDGADITQKNAGKKNKKMLDRGNA